METVVPVPCGPPFPFTTAGRWLHLLLPHVDPPSSYIQHSLCLLLSIHCITSYDGFLLSRPPRPKLNPLQGFSRTHTTRRLHNNPWTCYTTGMCHVMLHNPPLIQGSLFSVLWQCFWNRYPSQSCRDSEQSSVTCDALIWFRAVTLTFGLKPRCEIVPSSSWYERTEKSKSTSYLATFRWSKQTCAAGS